MTTAKKIIGQAMGALGLRANGQAIDGNDLVVCLEKLNTLVDFHNINIITRYAQQVVSAPLAPGASMLLIGPGQALNIAPRTYKIEDGCFVRSGEQDYPMKQITLAEYNSESIKTIGGYVPECFYYNPAVPNGEITFYPPPAGTVTVFMVCGVRLNSFADLETNYDIPPGYERFLYTNLATEIAPDFEREVPPSVAIAAAGARRAIEAANLVPKQIRFHDGYKDREATGHF